MNNNFATTSSPDKTLVGQFLTSIWYKVKIPTEGDYECAVIRTTPGVEGTAKLAKTVELMTGCEEGEISCVPTVEIYHRLTAGYLMNVREKLRKRLFAEPNATDTEYGTSSIHDSYAVRRGTFGMAFEAARSGDTTLFCMCNPSFTLGG